jgi:hypothetical protein
LSRQTRQDVFCALNNQSQMELEKRGPNHRITAKRFSATSVAGHDLGTRGSFLPEQAFMD